MKKQPIQLTAQMIILWKQAVIDYLRKLYAKMPDELVQVLLAPDILNPIVGFKGEYLLKPGQKASKAYYLKKGMAKLFLYDEFGVPKIFHIWEADSIIVVFKAFREKLPSEDYYIQLMEDSELVSITNFCMDEIYEEHTAAYELTQRILVMKTERRILHIMILTMVDKKRRYCELKKLFPGLFIDGKCRLSNEEVVAFINISDFTLKESRKLCPG